MARDADPVIQDLRRWGYAHANRYAYSYSRATREHILENAASHAPQTVERALMELAASRGGQSRRRLMASNLKETGLRAVPTWAVDPIGGRNDADRPRDLPEIAVDMGIPEDLRWIDRALASISKQYPIRALVLRTEFTVAASQGVKARMVAEQYGGKLTLRQYRYELSRALDWIEGRMAA
ncbi:hypothetical protein EA658_16605 [Pseudoxanthomonas winnipegensis]|uniref:Uncharacterized protein n=1 Tax=Pseudoxanthomonas winnipegensis TaxID=2480810 RepID=A0ABY1WCH6_9GAMM|nr:hypothetical protein [Pseudoxanthomonas winnipegensis]TAA11284.1 hypothetical protein EA659_08020 [Pseudoxanthomonas winnipegensis]TAA18707.1 hypothetical protein EA658_16605 [Pseudoxanthomonas winnipegensis]TAH73917.1 hypothetical protein EA657_00140 [Pseudoxanthomonas winnipegensis]